MVQWQSCRDLPRLIAEGLVLFFSGTPAELWGSLEILLHLSSFEIRQRYRSVSVCVATYIFESEWKIYLIVKELFFCWFVLMFWLHVLLLHKIVWQICSYLLAYSTWFNFLNQAFILPVDARSSKNSTKYNLYPTYPFVVGGCWSYTESYFYNTTAEHSNICSSFAACNIWCVSHRSPKRGISVNTFLTF